MVGDAMITVLTNADKYAHSHLFDQMFRGRAAVFRDRLGWEVQVVDGREMDHYDEFEDPVYLIAIDHAGQLTGSLRLLPTTGETMLCNEFASFFDEPVDVRSPTAWECTRFCVHPAPEVCDENRHTSSDLLIGLCELALSSGIDQVVGLYDHTMTRVYRRIGWSPTPIATSRPQVGRLIVGIWDVSLDALSAMRQRANGDFLHTEPSVKAA